MFTKSALISLIAGFAIAACAEPPEGHKLAWSDEFNGATLDLSKWNYRLDSRLMSVQKKENVSVSNGVLRLELKKEPAGKLNFTAGGVISKQLFKYGYYEARFKCPPTKGWHTSFWMMRYGGAGGKSKSDAVQELDVCENDSIDPRSYSVNLHRHNPKPHKGFGAKRVKTPDLSADFHVWGCEFTEKEIKYYFDGKLVQTIDATQISHGEQNVWLTTVGGDPGKTYEPDDSRLPVFAEFDWVRVYERKE